MYKYTPIYKKRLYKSVYKKRLIFINKLLLYYIVLLYRFN